MAPSVVAKSGTVIQVAEQRDEAGADADAEQGDADGQAHGQHRTEREDQHDDGEAEADELGLGRFELGQHLTADLDGQAVDAWAVAP